MTLRDKNVHFFSTNVHLPDNQNIKMQSPSEILLMEQN